MIMLNNGTNSNSGPVACQGGPRMGMADVSSFLSPVSMKDVVSQSWFPTPEPAHGLWILGTAEILAAFLNLPELKGRQNHVLVEVEGCLS